MNVYLAILDSTYERKVLSVSKSKETAINSIRYQRNKELTEGYFSKYLTENTNIKQYLNEGCFTIAIEGLVDAEEMFCGYNNYSDYYINLFIEEMELLK